MDYGIGLNPFTGQPGIGLNEGGLQYHTSVPLTSSDSKPAKVWEDSFRASRRRQDAGGAGKARGEDPDDVSSVASKAKAAQEAAEAKVRAAKEEAQAKDRAEKGRKADEAYLQKVAAAKPILEGKGLGHLAVLLADLRLMRLSGHFGGDLALAMTVSRRLGAGWTIRGVSDEVRETARESGLLRGFLKDRYTVQVIRMASPDGRKTESVDARVIRP